MRIQFVYDSTNFTAQGVSVPVRISQLRFRPAATSTATTWAGGTWPNVRIDLATCPTDHLAVSPAFASNRGADAQNVYLGPVAVTAGAGQGAGTLLPAYITIPLQTPFVYDPAQGDLTLDIQLGGAGWLGSSTAADHVTGPTALGTRIFSTVNATAANGTIGTQYVAICEFGYAPATGLIPQFTATPLRGSAPLTVQFTDHTYTDDPLGVTNWAWDFDNDGVVDSTQRNPTWTYAACGDFTVSLQAFDGIHGGATETKVAFVRTEEVTADFTSAALGNGSWQLTDTTTPPPTAWAWDVDADGTIESTAQNPILQLGNACSRTVRLDAVRACRQATRSRTILLAPASLATNLTGGSGSTSSTTVGNLFDVQVAASEGITVCGLTTASYFGLGPFSVAIYSTPDSYVGKDATASSWRLVGTGTGVMSGGTAIAPSLNSVVLSQPFHLPAGNHGLAVYCTSASGTSYLAFSAASAGPFSNSDLSIHPLPATAPGIVRTGLFAGTALTPRQWNGRLHYTKVSLNGRGGHGLFGLGCSGTAGVPGNVATTDPRIGAMFTVAMDNLPQNVDLYWWGASRSNSSFGMLPFDLGPLGAPGCLVRVSLDASVLLVGSAGTATFGLALPNNPAILGVQLYAQGLSLDPAANALGLVASDATAFIVGN